MTRDRGTRPVSWLGTGVACRCPRCGEGRLFTGFLTVVDRCESCGLPLAEHDSGDGPAVLLIFVLGFVVVPIVLWIEMAFRPALWVHAIVSLVLVLGLALAMLRPAKAMMLALQYRNRPEDFEGGDDARGPGSGGA
ncbi:MAG: DUF983 domain-containing protein [Azospirillaceae bacterium]